MIPNPPTRLTQSPSHLSHVSYHSHTSHTFASLSHFKRIPYPSHPSHTFPTPLTPFSQPTLLPAAAWCCLCSVRYEAGQVVIFVILRLLIFLLTGAITLSRLINKNAAEGIVAEVAVSVVGCGVGTLLSKFQEIFDKL